jgi:hypothetical protein
MTDLNRAKRIVLCAAAGVAMFASSWFADQASGQEAREIRLDGVPLLFVDDSGIATRSGVSRTVHVAKTLDKPVIVSDGITPSQRVYVYGSVAVDETGLIKLWYNTRLDPKSGDYVLYATSRDGIAWDKPALRLFKTKAWNENNIVFNLHSPSVLVDRFEKNPERRYKMVGHGKANNVTGYQAATSPDGIHWTMSQKTPILPGGDTVTFSQDASTGQYLVYHKNFATVRGIRRRSVWLSRSDDFESWSKPELVFTADEEDDAFATKPIEHVEVYNMSVYPHAAGFIGLPTMFRVIGENKHPEPGQSPVDGPIDVQLVTSADGQQWRRTWPRVNVIPRGSPGAFDAGAFLGVSSTAAHVGDETWVYYTALTTGHGGPIPAKQLSIGRAAWRRHGWISLDADPVGGRIETKPLTLPGSTLVVNADASRGELRVAIVEADGSSIAGYTLEDCEVLRKDATRWTAEWKNRSELPTDRPVRVVIEMKSTRLFNLESGH